uniref:Spermidine/putrescine import ATP-binding protein PotA n=1 Tax=Candidatus Kentrum sp. FW TaxID=2126338 RepID=A0A450T5Y3_9GAMM|nr:MAG: spermidine/putrescine transport system ATP-binding protein/putrescine transport system ATP-binding protein [Candidatus Kentron sp. FW]
MRDSPFIRLENVCKDFGAMRAVDKVSLNIRRGEFFGLLGPSGCGKTTLLRMLAGFESPDSGEIRFDGQSMARVAPYARPVNMVFQNYALFPHLNVTGNIAFGLRRDRLPRRELERRVKEVLELVRLDGYGSRDVNELSGGERQRVALGRALIKRPKVLLLDEPLGALDKKLRERMQIELRGLQRAIGITFVFVTHDQDEALAMSDRIAVMSLGRILEVGSPARLYEQPKTRFVAEFLGTMNFFSGKVRGIEGNSLLVDTAGLGRIRALNRDNGIDEGDSVTVGIRPENIVIEGIAGKISSPTDINRVPGAIIDTAYFGDRMHIYVSVEGVRDPVSVTMQNFDGAASSGNNQGSVMLRWSEQSTLLIQSGPGNR